MQIKIVFDSIDALFCKVQQDLDVLTPRELSQILVELSVYLGILGDFLSDAKADCGILWTQARQTVKSDRHADQVVRCNMIYRNRIKIECKIDAIKEVINTLKKRIEVLNNESKNQY